MSTSRKNPALTGITVRHRKRCLLHDTGLGCNCKPSYRAEVHNPATRRPIKSPSFKSLAEARSWRARKQLAYRNAAYQPEWSPTVREAALDWLGKAQTGEVLNRSGRPYKPSVVRSYETSLRLYGLPIIGAMKLANVRRRDVQELAERVGLERGPSTVRNAMNPLRAIFRRACQFGLVEVNPTDGLTLPAVEGGRERIATPDEAEALIAMLPPEDRGIWATAMYAGLRLGELRALRTEDLDLASGLIHVRHSWDSSKGLVDPKSRAGKRAIPIPQRLHDYLVRHVPPSDDEAPFVFRRPDGRPFAGESLRKRAHRIWTRAGMEPIGFHEARHTYASLCIAAGVNAKALSTFMGHSSISTTFDRYGKLFPGSEGEAKALLDEHLERPHGSLPTPMATP